MAPRDFDPQLTAGTALDSQTTPYTRTGTGLDFLTDQFLKDPGLNLRTSDADIQAGVAAAAAMNALIVSAIKATGVANDGTIAPADVHAIAGWLKSNHAADWVRHHGDDDNGVETGFHRIQGDGGALYAFGDKQADQVGDGIYHLGFGTRGDRLVNEDGNANARVEEVAYWLNGLLEADLSQGTLANGQVSAKAGGTTSTGLDALTDAINDDAGLNRRVTLDDIVAGAKAADAMNAIIIEGITANGYADDGRLDVSEVYALSDWISANRLADWTAAHGDDDNGVETGFHRVQNDGAEAQSYGRNTVNTIADAIYHLGFGYAGDRLVNEDGNANERVEDVTYWLSDILSADLAAGTLASGNGPALAGSTGTGLDVLVDLIASDAELNRRIPLDEISDGADAADTMNSIVVDGIKALGLGQNGALSAGDVRDLSDWIRSNHLQAWKVAHGDDAKSIETGFHLVQGDGAISRSFGSNAVNTIADGIYHLGFGYKNGRLINEDGNANASLDSVAHWLNTLLAGDLASGALDGTGPSPYPTGTTGTSLDAVVDLLMTDPRLTRDMKTSDLAGVARDVDGLNAILVDGITASGVARDGNFNSIEIQVLGQWIKDNKQAEWTALRGDDDADTGIAGLRWDGAVSQMAGVNLVNKFTSALYGLGYTQKWGGIIDEDGDWLGTADDLASWLNSALSQDLAAGTFGGMTSGATSPADFAAHVVAASGPVSVRDDDDNTSIAHTGATGLAEGTVALTFMANDPASSKTQVLFSKDASGSNEGDMRVYFYQGNLHIKVSTAGKDHYVRISDAIDAGTAHDLAVSFGQAGLAVWLDGVQVAYRSDIPVDWTRNTNDIIVGASNGHQSASNPDDIRDHFQGEVLGFAVYDIVLDRSQVESLSSGVTSGGTAQDDAIAGTDGQDALSGGLGRDVIVAGAGNDVVHGGYGADRIEGGHGNDVLDGGHGQDALVGGDGDDILISTSDGREQTPGQYDPAYAKRVRPDNGDLDPATGKLFPNQPIAADDILTGGAGADTFRFQFLINAKFDIIMKHARSDGSINWRGVAGENTYVHDHWVDMIGNDTITDFNRAEGDRIELAGHTLNVTDLSYGDANGDGTNDYTVITFTSIQANGGAHDNDALGTLTVYGDLVTLADIDQVASNTVFYGIVDNIADINEAVTPRDTDSGTAAATSGGLTAGTTTGPRGADNILTPTGTGGTTVTQAPRSATGLDTLLDWIETDAGLLDRISTREISDGSAAAAAMNAIVIEAIKATGAANDGTLDAGDVYSISDWIKANRYSDWIRHHGDDENNLETGFHLVQNDGAAVYQYGRNSINTIADAIYHLGFGYKNGRLINEDGNSNERVEDVAYWLSDILKTDLANGSLSNTAAPAPVTGTTGTGLDALVDVIQTDPELSRRIPDSEQQDGAQAADAMNVIIVNSIKALGLANDGSFTASDVMALSEYIRSNHFAAWKAAHGDDAKSIETGFHLVQGDGAVTRMFGDNAVNTVADGLYHLGFGYKNGRLINEDGNGNARIEDVADWLNSLLASDMASLGNAGADPLVSGRTRTGLDSLVDLIQADPGLNRKISLTEITAGADAADTMNQIIVQSIRATGIGNNGEISVGDVMVLSDHIKANYYGTWKTAHGDDASSVETGFHKVQGDGGETRLFGDAAVNTVADGLYHLGFGYKNGRLINEDGNGNASLSDVAGWLTALLAGDLAGITLTNAIRNPYVQGSTGTGLDALVEMVTTDVGLGSHIKTTDIEKAAKAADAMNAILIEGIKATGIANDGAIDAFDVMDLDTWVRDNHASAHRVANGANGFDLAEIWGAASPLFGKDGINDVADAIYNIGFGTKYGNAIVDENGNWNARTDDIAAWLSGLLAQDLHDGSLFSAAAAYTDPAAFAADKVAATTADIVANGTDGYLNIAHDPSHALRNGTVAFDVTADTIPQDANVTLFSKDARDYGNGGHTQIYLDKGTLYVRVQTASKSHYVKAELATPLQEGQTYALALTFGQDGVQLFVDGQRVANRPDLAMDWSRNSEDMIFGANGGWRNASNPDHVYDVLDGTISGAAVYGRVLTAGEIAGLHGTNTDVTPTASTPVDQTPVDQTPVDQTPVDQTPVDQTPVDQTPVDQTPVDQTPVDQTPVDQTPVDQTPVDQTPVDQTPVDQTPVIDQSNTTMQGDDAQNTMVAIAGANTIDGGGNGDLIIGGIQNDTLSGGSGNDVISGDHAGGFLAGADAIRGGTGDDVLQGGRGADSFYFGIGDGSDVIAKFVAADVVSDQAGGFTMVTLGADFTCGVDKIVLEGFQTLTAGTLMSGGFISAGPNGARFSAEGTTIDLVGIDAGDLSADDFVLV